MMGGDTAETLIMGVNVVSTCFTLLLFSTVWRYLSKKPLGMQTPFDQMIKDLLVSTFACSVTANMVHFRCGPFQSYPDLALAYFYFELFTAHTMFLQAFFTIFMRYLYICHASWINDVYDSTVIAMTRYINLGMSFLLASYELLFQDYRQGKMYQYLTNIPNEHVRNIPSSTVKIMVAWVIIMVVIMQIRIEMRRHRTNERIPDLGYSFWTLRSMAVLMSIGGLLVFLWLIDEMVDKNVAGLRRLVLHTMANIIMMNLLPAVMILRHPQMASSVFSFFICD